ncbi:MAG TPA: LPS assembly lipoprotein LptE [Burkholderiales bacterium]|nr:LPS assembly lipoprotein LptE [Burkholderiales bacterium]
MFLLVTTLSGCGFRLRGHADLPFESIYVDTPGYSVFANQLRRAIRAGTNAKLTDQPQEAQVVLRIVSEAQDKVILSLSSAGRVSEFDLRYRVNYRLLNHASVDIVPPAEIVLHRDLTYSDFEILAKASEEQLLYNDMKADAVQQLLRRLSAIKLPS